VASARVTAHCPSTRFQCPGRLASRNAARPSTRAGVLRSALIRRAVQASAPVSPTVAAKYSQRDRSYGRKPKGRKSNRASGEYGGKGRVGGGVGPVDASLP